MKSKILALCNIIIFLILFTFFIPHNKYDESFQWKDSVSIITTIPKGSYSLTVTLTGAQDNDTLSVTSPQNISSIYSVSCSTALSQYGTVYTIPFETYTDNTEIILEYTPAENTIVTPPCSILSPSR